MYLPLLSNDPNHEKNYNKRIKYAENYGSEHPLDIQEVAADEIRALRKEFWFDAVSWTRYHSRDMLAEMYYDTLEAR